MGAFKKCTIVHVDDDNETYFFSTDHCQETDEAFVPVTFYYEDQNEVKEIYFEGYKEIENPDPDYKP